MKSGWGPGIGKPPTHPKRIRLGSVAVEAREQVEASNHHAQVAEGGDGGHRAVVEDQGGGVHLRQGQQLVVICRYKVERLLISILGLCVEADLATEVEDLLGRD